MTSSSPGRGTGATVACVLMASASLATAAILAGWLSAGALPFVAAPVLFLGAALPLILRWTPVDEPSALKVFLLASLLSPALVTCLVLALEGSGATHPWPWAFVSVAGLQLLALRRPLRFAAPGRAAWATLAFLALLAALLGYALLGLRNAPRLTHDGALWTSGVVSMFERSGPAENPWLAGTALPTHAGYALLVRTIGHTLGLAAPSAQALVSIWALATLPLALYLLAAPLWRESRRNFLAAPLAFFGWNAWAGWRALGSGASELEVGTLAGVQQWAGELAVHLPGAAQGSVLYGGSAFFGMGPGAPALALAVGAWMCAAHALRHAKRPWVGLCGLLHALSAVIDPSLGLAAALATAVTALVHPGIARVRASLLLSILGWGLPALWLARTSALHALPLREPAAGWPGLGAFLFPAALLAPAALGLLSGRWREAGGSEADARGRRTILLLLLLAVVSPVLIGTVWEPAAPHRPLLFRLASLPLGLLAAGGLIDLLSHRRLRPVGALVALALLVGGGRATAQAFQAHARFARSGVPAVERGGELRPTFPDELQAPGDGLTPEVVPFSQAARQAQAQAVREVRRRHLGLALRWVRDELVPKLPRAVILHRMPPAEIAALAPDPLTLYADLPMWVDGHGEHATASLRWSPRQQRIADLYGDPGNWDVRLMTEFESLDRPAIFLVEERDRAATYPRGAWKPFRGIDLRLLRLGCERVHVEGTVAVYLFSPGSAR